ncbi:MAG: DUF1203 domain-containing protein [Alphaproteobacteria bacterium]|nr:DUF1203 domain-containing protein [Alphaproteobacteria bacterium]MDE2630282.1 DUF1203 domain-containing protein [Alphaproteobacteria bacterium]
MKFRFQGLSVAPFRSLFALGDGELAARGMRRMIADAKPGFPCRVSLEDAEPGERVLLANFEHQPAHSPYRATGPIFVRESAGAPYDSTDVPPVLRGRLLSLRAYDADGMIVDADVVPGDDVESALSRLFARDGSAYVHIHNAKRGCYACRVEQA